MPTFIPPLRRIRIHRQIHTTTWAVYCPCCWADRGWTYSNEITFNDACEWAAEHIAAWHPRNGGWTNGPCCTNSTCPRCDNGRRNH